MRSVTSYQLVSESSAYALSKAVMEALDEGYEPFGSPFYAPEGSGYFCQAIVQMEEEA